MIQHSVQTFIFCLGIPFTIYGLYYVIIGIHGLQKHNKFPEAAPTTRFAIAIAARNEAGVVGNLIDTLKAQHYPKERFDIYVLPNNCTDNTEEVALAHGARIFRCSDKVHSKGAALSEFFDGTFKDNDNYDAFCIFDADNLVDPDFLQGMNNAYCAGEVIGQGYRESKNPKTSWVSGSQSIFYYTLNRFLNLARYNSGLSAALNGTGWMVAASVLKDGGFHTFSLTEDIEFTTQNILKGRKVAWIPEAKTYDEHPIDFWTSWKQRKRWSTGTYQCFWAYTPVLWKAFRKYHRWACLDMICYLLAPLLQVLQAVYSVVSIVIAAMVAINLQVMTTLELSVVMSLASIVLLPIGTAIVVSLEHHKLNDVKLDSYWTFWWYLNSWMIINITCILEPLTTWEPIAHTQAMSMEELQSIQAKPPAN